MANLDAIVKQLETERDRIDSAIRAVRGIGRPQREVSPSATSQQRVVLESRQPLVRGGRKSRASRKSFPSPSPAKVENEPCQQQPVGRSRLHSGHGGRG